MNKIVWRFVVLGLTLVSFCGYGQDIKERFNGSASLDYRVYLNGVPSGKIQWRYEGR